MFLTKKNISRRTMLRGAGAVVALPFLESMIPAQTPLSKTAASQLRLGFLYVPHGAVMAKWNPIGDGTKFEFSETLAPVAPFRDNLVILSGLANQQAMSAPGEGGGDHGRSPASWLSGVRPKRTEAEDVRVGITLDQVAAQKMGQETMLPSLELATEDTTGLVGACDVGYSCTYINTLSWRTANTPNPMEINPRLVFERMFGEGGNAAERLSRMQRQSSLLDAVTHQVKRLQGDLGEGDKRRMNDYLENVREIERRIQLAEKRGESQVSSVETPLGVPDKHEDHSKLLLDLMALAYQADITRVITFMMARELSSRTFENVGVPDPFHGLSHHQNDPDKLTRLAKVNKYHVGLVAYFLDKLKNTQDGDGSLLDHSLLVFGSCMANSNLHEHAPLPAMLIGGANGALKGGRHLKFRENTPWVDTLSTVADKARLNLTKFGESTGPLSDV
jgi:hypothetical protein